jgi:hypothetical protein
LLRRCEFHLAKNTGATLPKPVSDDPEDEVSIC